MLGTTAGYNSTCSSSPYNCSDSGYHQAPRIHGAAVPPAMLTQFSGGRWEADERHPSWFVPLPGAACITYTLLRTGVQPPGLEWMLVLEWMCLIAGWNQQNG